MSASENLPLVRIQLRYPDENTFVERFAPNVTRGGIFLSSRTPAPAGSTIRFEVCLVNGSPVFSGTGKVTWVREFDPKEPQRAHGMGVQFTSLSTEARLVLDRILAKKAAPPRPAPPSAAPSSPAAGTPPPTTDTDLGTLFSLSDEEMKNVIARARVLASRTDDVEALRIREPEEPITLEKALSDLPRILGREGLR